MALKKEMCSYVAADRSCRPICYLIEAGGLSPGFGRYGMQSYWFWPNAQHGAFDLYRYGA